MNLVLFGYRGCGKTLLGRRLSERLRWPLHDTDATVRVMFGGAEIADIWREHGEPAFRAAEVSAVAALMEIEDPAPAAGRVIALGGGTILQADVPQLLRRQPALLVYLRAEPAELARRLAADPKTAGQRPSLTGARGAVAEIAGVLKQRDPRYLAAADLVLEVGELTPAEAEQQLLFMLRRAMRVRS